MRADGTAANKAAAEDGDPAVVAECMSVATHNGETLSAGDRIQLADTGGVYRVKPIVPSSGSAGSPIIYEEYSGDTPLLYGSEELTGSSYKWTASGSGTNEYYCEASGGGDPSLTEPDLVVFHNAAPASVVELSEGTAGSLADHEYDWGDNDSLGYNTVYVRDDTGDPDVSGVTIEASQRGCFLVSSKDYITVDGLTFKYGINPEGGLRSEGCSYLTVQNCSSAWNQQQGVSTKKNYCTIDNCTSEYDGGHGLAAGGTGGSHGTHCVIKNSTAHHCRNISWSGWDGYGIKFLFIDDGEIHNNTSYSNYLPGINLDGNSNGGCYRTKIYENKVYDNGYQGILVEWRSDRSEVYRNLLYDNCTYNTGSLAEIALTQSVNVRVHHNVVYRTKAPGNVNSKMVYVQDYNPGRGDGGTILYSNTFDAGGYATRCVEFDGYDILENTEIKNNIIVRATTPCLRIASASSNYTGFESDYNCFLRSDADPDVIRRQYVMYTIVEHDASFNDDSNSVVGDPVFTDSGAGDYSLQSSSPCVNTGTDLGDAYEIALLPESSWPSSVVAGSQRNY